MPASLSWLLLPAAVSLALAQDGYNLYKDIQRGKVEELERFITDEDYQIDHTALTWPSAGARLQVPNSAKRTMNRFKTLRLLKPAGEEGAEEDEVQPTASESKPEEGDEETRILIPRTHVMLRGDPFKRKRALLRTGHQLSSADGYKQISTRDSVWMVTAGRFFPITRPILLSFERCKQLTVDFRGYYQCVDKE